MADNIKIAYIVDKKQLEASNKELEKTVKGNDLTQKEVTETNKKFASQEKQLSKTNKAFSSMGDQLKALGNRFTIAGKGVGDMGAGLLKTASGAGKASKAMKVLKIAIASTGIGLLLIAFASLATMLTKTQGGSDKLGKAMERVGAITDVLIGRFATFGKGVFSLFTGDLKGAIDSFRGSITGIGDEIDGAIAGADRISKATIELRNIEIEITKTTAERRREIQDLLFITRDMTKSLAEQKEALKKADELELANQADQVKFAEKKLELARLDLNETPLALQNDEQRLSLAQAQAAVQDVLANSKAKQREIENRQNELQNRIVASEKIKTAEAENQLAISEQLESATDRQIEALKTIADFEIDPLKPLIGITGDQMQEGIAMIQEGNEAINESNLNRSLLEISQFKTVAEAKEMIAFGLADSLAIIAGKGSAVSKAVALADIAYGTGKGFIQGLDIAQKGAAGTGPLAPFTFPVFLATQLAAVVGAAAQAKGILTTAPKFEQGGRVGGNLHSGGGTMIEAELGEHVMTRKASAKYGHGFFKSLNNLELNPDVLSGLSGGSAPIIINSDNKELINEYRNRPITNLSISENGITKRTQRNNQIIQKKLLRYKS